MFSLKNEKQDEDRPQLVETKYSQQVQAAVDEISGALLGKDHQIRLALCCLFSGGHLLVEDLPGMGKTTLSYALAK
ncbi:MAG: AAA family ATPase, partial [Pseudohongiellaceae bacterium]